MRDTRLEGGANAYQCRVLCVTACAKHLVYNSFFKFSSHFPIFCRVFCHADLRVSLR